MLPKMPGRLGGAAQRISSAAQAAKPAMGAKVNKMKILKDKVAPMKQRKARAPLQKSMPMPKKEFKPMQKLPRKLPGSTPEWMKPGYSPGSILKGYTKYAKGGKSDTQNA